MKFVFGCLCIDSFFVRSSSFVRMKFIRKLSSVAEWSTYFQNYVVPPR